MVYRLIALTGSFLTVTCLSVALYRIMFASRREVLDRLAVCTSEEAALRRPAATGGGAREDLYRFLGAVGKVVTGRSYLKKSQQKLIQARIFMKAEEFAGLSVFCGLGFLFLFYLFTGSLLLAVPAGLLGLKFPALLVDRKKRRRMNDINQQLPEALSIIANGLRAGFSFPQAISVVSREMDPPIAEEFARVTRDNRLGKPMDDALRELTERTDSDDLDLVVTALLIQRQVGGNLAEILDNISHTIRERIRIKGEIRTLTTQGKITAVIITLLPPAVAAMVLAFNPEYMLILAREPMGLFMLGTALLMQIFGVIIIRRIINIEI